MGYKNLKQCVLDLEKNGHLVRIHEEVDPYLEMAAIHRRVNQAQGPALFFEKVKGSPFPAVSNLFGTYERAQFIFRDTLGSIKKLFELKGNPQNFFKNPFRFADVPFTALKGLPQKVSNASIFECTTSIGQLPQIQSWPKDGGAFVLLPQVYTEDLENPGIMKSNLGMYRIQLSGNDYAQNQEVGLHYQIRRDIGIHHTKAQQAGQPLRVSLFIGGPPANTFAAVMYLPEGMPEVAFAGVLGGRRFRYAVRDGFTVAAEADFCITGWVDPNQTKPEGPFGDHLGYYSLTHSFPFLKVDKVYHRKDAIWPFTVVGRPPQEDSVFGKLVQEIAGPVIKQEIPGVKAVHAVDACGVHPLMLAIGKERYTPYQKRKPQELLTLANALLGYGPCSLSKYLFIVNEEDCPNLDIHNVEEYITHLLEYVDWRQDLHFQTATTMDTLDYSGTALNEGSKLVIAATGEPKRKLAKSIPSSLSLPEGFIKPKVAIPGVMMIQGPAFESYESAEPEVKLFAETLREVPESFPLIILVDDGEFASKNLNNFLWVTFTRSNPSHDIYGAGSFTEFKHWGCDGPLVIDARLKPHHAPSLEEDAGVAKRVDSLAISGKSLHGII